MAKKRKGSKSKSSCKCKGTGKKRRCWRHVKGQIRGCKKR